MPATAPTPVGAPGVVAGVTLFDAADAGPVPTALVAFTVNVYAVPFDSPENTVEVTFPTVLVAPPGDAVTVYPVTGEPPLLAGGVHDNVACPFPAIAPTPVGAPGTVGADDGVTLFDDADAGPVPTALVAFTVNVYAVPFDSPENTVEVTFPTVLVAPPGDAVTVYPVTGEPPSLAGGDHDTDA